jgi:PAS domain S-box-containing protein
LRERNRSDEELRRYKRFFETAAVGLGVGLPDGTLGVVNPAFARMHRRSARGTRRRFSGSPVRSEELSALAEARDIVAAKGHHYFESVHLRHDGTRFPIAVDLTAVRDIDGRLLYRIASVSDITERKRVAGRDRTLARIDDAVRTLEDPDAITESVCRIAGEHLRVNRCAYAWVEEDAETFHFARSFNRDVPGWTARLRSRSTVRVWRVHACGQPWIIEDSETDPCGRRERRIPLRQSALGVALPFSRSGRW